MKSQAKFDQQAADIEKEMREHTRVTVPTICVFEDGSGNSLDTAIIFIKAGDSTYDAGREAEEAGGVRNAHLITTISLPADFREQEIPYWNHPYVG